jgi:Protein of unknown function (DUF3052)
MAAGYSTKPLWQKLAFAEDRAVVLIDAPRGFAIAGIPRGTKLKRERGGTGARSPAPSVLAFFTALAALRDALPALAERIFPDGALWVAWPRKAGGHDSDIREQDVRDAALPLGLVDVKVAALDEDWSGLRLVWRKERRAAAPARSGAAAPAARG